MLTLSKNLSLNEFTKSQTAIRLGIDNTPTEEHLKSAILLAKEIFQPIREHFNNPIYVSSGYRCEALNEAIGGSKKSQHSKGEAIDIDMDNRNSVSNADVFYHIRDNLPFDQLIWEFGDNKCPDWVHVSHESNGQQRGQVLVSRRNSQGKVYYWAVK
jgi:hypothetical protein